MAVASFTWKRSLGSGLSSHISVMRDDSVEHDDDVSSVPRTLAFQSNQLKLTLIPLDDIDDPQTVVLKTPKPDRTGETAARVRQEARIMATLRHPHIVAYKGQMMRPSWGLLVQLCPKGTLRDRIRWHQVHGSVPLKLLFFIALKETSL
jgi:serine/threonine protein kinase